MRGGGEFPFDLSTRCRISPGQRQQVGSFNGGEAVESKPLHKFLSRALTQLFEDGLLNHPEPILNAKSLCEALGKRSPGVIGLLLNGKELVAAGESRYGLWRVLAV